MAQRHTNIPILTDAIGGDEPRGAPERADEAAATEAILEHTPDTDAASAVAAEPAAGDPDEAFETLVAELQTRLASQTFVLTEDIMRTAFAEMEAKLHHQISARLRRELPELIDTLLREYLRDDRDA